MRPPPLRAALLLLTATLAVSAIPSRAAEGPGALGQAEFPHEQHYLEFEIECVTCHHETNAEDLGIPHEQYFEHFADLWANCKSCHGNGSAPATPRSCGDCHHDSPTDVADETLSAKVVIHRNCWTCHEVGVGQSASQSCKHCHPGDDGAADQPDRTTAAATADTDGDRP